MIASRFDNGATYCASSKRYDALSALALVARTGRTCSAYHPHLGRIDSPQTQMSVAMVKPAPANVWTYGEFNDFIAEIMLTSGRTS
jgi:hypothetical protein